MEIHVEIDGIEQLNSELKEICSKEKISDALEKSAIIVEKEAIYRCPVQFGKLRDSITHRKISDLTQEVAATANYADYIEYGTIGSPGGTPEQPLIYTSSPPGDKYPSYRPFLRSALYSKMNEIEELFNKMLNSEKPE